MTCTYSEDKDALEAKARAAVIRIVTGSTGSAGSGSATDGAEPAYVPEVNSTVQKMMQDNVIPGLGRAHLFPGAGSLDRHVRHQDVH